MPLPPLSEWNFDKGWMRECVWVRLLQQYYSVVTRK